jgi:hypothetical protein
MEGNAVRCNFETTNFHKISFICLALCFENLAVIYVFEQSFQNVFLYLYNKEELYTVLTLCFSYRRENIRRDMAKTVYNESIMIKQTCYYCF